MRQGEQRQEGQWLWNGTVVVMVANCGDGAVDGRMVALAVTAVIRARSEIHESLPFKIKMAYISALIWPIFASQRLVREHSSKSILMCR